MAAVELSPIQETLDRHADQKEEVKQQQEAHPYVNYFKQLSKKQSLPDLTITFEDLERTLLVPKKDQSIPNLVKFCTGIFRKKEFREFHAIQKTNGVIRPGTMTLILAPPGHGKSTLLKCLAGQYKASSGVTGKVLYNGCTYEENLKNNVHVSRLVTYVDQIENNLPLLTVRETFEFAVENCCVDPTPLGDSELTDLHKQKVNMMLNFLGLEECAETIVGNEMLRGVSGGQKRRVTVGEMLLSDARAFFLDEISNGLDAVRTMEIFILLKQWCKLVNCSVTATLLQPAPALFELFDDLILLRDGAIVYHGPVNMVKQYFESLGVVCPRNQDFADFITEYLTDPALVWEALEKRKAREAAASSSLQSQNNSQQPSKQKPPLSTAQLLQAWEKHPLYAQQKALMDQVKNSETAKPLQLESMSRFSQLSYGSAFPHSFAHHLYQNLQRQVKILTRNKKFIYPRLFQYVFFALILGSLFWDLSDNQYGERMGIMIFVANLSAFANASEIPLAVESKNVVVKQVRAGFYSPLANVIATMVVHFPLACFESMIFCVILYFMTNMVNDAGCFFLFYFVVLLVALSMSTFLRSICFMTSSKDVAQMISAPIIMVLMLFGGFLITYDHIPDFMIEFYWFSPFSWALRLLMQNEYFNSHYDYLTTAEDGSLIRFGDLVLDSYEVSKDKVLGWMGILYLLGYYILFGAISSWCLGRSSVELSRGTKRLMNEEVEAMELAHEDNKLNVRSLTQNSIDIDIAEIQKITAKADDQQQQLPQQQLPQQQLPQQQFPTKSSTLSALNFIASGALPFEPVILSFENVTYTVQVPASDGSKKTQDRVLLHDISGFALPGQMTALMGSSGAGKTTLMDVLAARKTEGQITGKILLNGVEPTPVMMSQLCGYCEQQDIHDGMSTVREALMFSAALRLPSSVTQQQRIQFVEETMKLLELDSIADRLVGDEQNPGLSPGQLKRLTIGVELVANPAVLFLDEPTSGLDSRSALVVMKTVRRIAACGRSVVVTIHQPSTELFLMFDRLLLLKSGGYTVYFGDVGAGGQNVATYFSTGGNPMPEEANPATFMLERLNDSSIDFVELYQESDLKKQADMDFLEVKQSIQNKPKNNTIRSTRYTQSFLYQYLVLLDRFNKFYFRNVQFASARFIKLLIVGILFGLCWFDVNDKDFAGVSSKIAVIFMGVVYAGSVQSSSILPVIMRNRAVYYREKLSNYYNPFAYVLSMCTLEIPYSIVSVLLFVIPLYFLVGLRNDFTLFVQFAFVTWVFALVTGFQGLAIVALTPNVMTANILQGFLLTFYFLFGGVYIRPGSIPVGWKWFYWIVPTAKALIAISTTQFTQGVDKKTMIHYNGVNVPRQDLVLNFLDAGADDFGPMVGWLFLTLFVYCLLVGISYARVSWVKR